MEAGLKTEIGRIAMGPPTDFRNFFGAVIDQGAFDSIKSYIDYARENDGGDILIGGGCDDSSGYFIEPTVILATDPLFKTMVEEIFGPVLTIHVYEDEKFEETLDGMHAVCLQHELDHLEGKLFVDYLSPLKRRMVLKKLEKARTQADKNGGRAKL